MATNRSAERAEQPDEMPGLLALFDSHIDLFGPHHPQTLAVANKLAVAFWHTGDINRAIGILDQVLTAFPGSLELEDPTRVDALNTLGKIMFEQRHVEQSCTIHREVWECHVRHAGPNHPNSLAAKGDLATVLFELGQDDEAGWLEQEAFDSARTHLGANHPVTSVLAWHRALSHERCGDLAASRSVVVNELVWLLAANPSCLEADQKTIRTLLAKRLNWDTARTC